MYGPYILQKFGQKCFKYFENTDKGIKTFNEAKWDSNGKKMFSLGDESYKFLAFSLYNHEQVIWDKVTISSSTGLYIDQYVANCKKLFTDIDETFIFNGWPGAVLKFQACQIFS